MLSFVIKGFDCFIFFMKFLNAIKGFQTYLNDDCLLVKVSNKLTAISVSNKIELEGYRVDVERNNDSYLVRIWGTGLIDAFLLSKFIAA